MQTILLKGNTDLSTISKNMASEIIQDANIENHPDIKIFSEPLSVDDARFIKTDSFIYPNNSAKKVYIILDAHQMTFAAQNALLKVLEEPATFTHFILTTNTSGILLDTIISRCMIYNFKGENISIEYLEYLEKFGQSIHSQLELTMFFMSINKLPKDRFKILLNELLLLVYTNIKINIGLNGISGLEHIKLNIALDKLLKIYDEILNFIEICDTTNVFVSMAIKIYNICYN